MIDLFEKGESISRTITLTDGTDPIDNLTFLTIEVKVFNVLFRTIGTYTMAGGEVTRLAPAADGQIFFVVPPSTTSNIRAMKYFYTVKTTEADPDYPGGVRTRTYMSWCFKLKATA